MAPATESVPKENRRLESTIAFAATLEKSLRNAAETLPLLTNTLSEQIDSIALIATSALANKTRDLDERGTRIWNLTSKLKDDAKLANIAGFCSSSARLCAADRCRCSSKSEYVSSIILVSVLTVCITDDIRVLRAALKASKYCLVIERAAFYEQRLQKISQRKNIRNLEPSIRRLSSEYHVLRIILAWRQERLDLAEIWLANLSPERYVLEAIIAEQMADVLFEIGRDQAKKQAYKSALGWLHRAHDILADQNPKDLSADASEVRSCIRHNTVRVLLKEPSEENVSRAWNIIHELEGEAGNSVVVWLLKLDLLSIDRSATHDYFEVLIHIVRQIQISDANMTTILHHVHKLRQQNARLAHTVLAALLEERLLTMNEMVWVEKTMVTMIWNCTTSQDLEDSTDALEELLDAIAAKTDTALGTSATHAAQILILKRVETAYSQEDYDHADIWCRLALHNVFGSSGTSNIGKLQRSIHSGADEEPTKDSTLLYACVLEAQKNGDRLQVILALSRVLKKIDYQATPGLQLPALLRLAARMLMQELENGQTQDENCIDELCKVFEGAAAAAKASQRDPSKTDSFPITELDWFSRNSYNVALKMCTIWKADVTLRMVQACSNVGGAMSQIKGTLEAD
ncbi:MAG: hypothetical protein Q9166_001361 [cf. Caloplaca sp. 2 TL-2023]